jgi:murein DD-endopeptidase MepM/ murein hydrolase activator NlpD
LVCKTLKDSALASNSWLAQSTGWHGSKTYKDYNIKQLAEKSECVALGVVTGDLDESPYDNEGSFKVNHLADLLSNRRVFLNNLDTSVCESSPTWDTAPKPASKPLSEMKWANDLEKDKFGCTRKNSSGNKKFHGGIDIKASVGTDCYATEDAVVTAIGFGTDLGKYVAIKFSKNGKIYGVGYCHLSKHDILTVGDSITAGTVVGKTGRTGNTGADAPHLHLEVHNGEWKTYDNDVDRSAHSFNPNAYIP